MIKKEISENTVFTGELILVNAQYGIKGGCEKELVKITEDVLLQENAARALETILIEIGGEKQIVPVSGFRSGKEQREIFQNSLTENGEDFTRKFVALPDHSEHQTGLAIDLGLKSDNIDFICPDFPYEGICRKFREIAPRYGFIERYPKGKENITGIAHEPWHFRYVGVPHAEIITENSFTLEEYTEFIKKYRYDCPLSVLGKNGAEVYYEEINGGKSAVMVPNNGNILISGNNIDGVIVTVFKE